MSYQWTEQTDLWEKKIQQTLLQECYLHALNSNDPSTKVAAILTDRNHNVVSYGINCFPHRLKETTSRWSKENKPHYVGHAERNAIYNAARRGTATSGLIMYCPWAACTSCANGIVESGISTLIIHRQAYERSSQRWMSEIRLAHSIMEECGVNIIQYDGKVFGHDFEISMGGELWSP